MSLMSFLMRRAFLKSDNKRDAGLTSPPDIERFNDIRYAPNKEATLEIYYPKGTTGKLPVIVSIHGGGYVYGSTNTYQFYGMNLAQRGFVFVNFNYRLAPRHKFPAPIEDTNHVMEWLIANADAYHVDLNNVFMVGDSAGGQLLSQYAAMVTNRSYADIMEIHPPKGFTLRAIGLNCGMYNIFDVFQGNTKSIMFDYFGRNYLEHGEKINVLQYINACYPPTFLLSAPGDFLQKFQQPMCDLIKQRGGRAEYHCYGDENTGHVFMCDLRNAYATKANDEECAFFRRWMTKEEES